MDYGDALLFRVEWPPSVVEQMTIDEMGHYLERFVTWFKRQKAK